MSTPALVGSGQASRLQPVGSRVQGGARWGSVSVCSRSASVRLGILPGEAFGRAR